MLKKMGPVRICWGILDATMDFDSQNLCVAVDRCESCPDHNCSETNLSQPQIMWCGGELSTVLRVFLRYWLCTAVEDPDFEGQKKEVPPEKKRGRWKKEVEKRDKKEDSTVLPRLYHSVWSVWSLVCKYNWADVGLTTIPTLYQHWVDWVEPQLDASLQWLSLWDHQQLSHDGTCRTCLN